MKKTALLLATTLLVGGILITGCQKEEQKQGETWELYVAASMKKPMDVLIEEFEEKTGDTINVNYSSSGALFSQIEQGQPCDVFFTADWIYVDKMEEIDMVAASEGFLTDNIALVVSENAKEKISSIKDLSKEDVTGVICDPSAPVGVYAETGLKEMELWDSVEENIVSRPSTVNQAAIMVVQDEVDAALIFTSVATANNLDIIEVMDQKYSGEIVFGAVAVKGEHEDRANEFLAYANQRIEEFEKYGWEAYEK